MLLIPMPLKEKGGWTTLVLAYKCSSRGPRRIVLKMSSDEA